MSVTRDSFHSRIGFVLAAAGSAIGLGNVWGFPTQAANNGGGAFVFVYLIVTVLLAFPALFAEIYLGNQAQKNPVGALEDACQDVSKRLGRYAGLFGLLGAILMLSFYSIVAGWMLSHALSPLMALLGFDSAATWLADSSVARNLAFTPIFIVLSALIINRGVHSGIERWSSRLMPVLFVLLIGLIIYILQQPGASEGVAMYLTPDFSQISDPKLIISAMGQAFFSLSIGVGGMMVYGSYMKKDADIGKLVISIGALDTLIAFLAGLLIIPTLFVAQHMGQQVFIDGQLIGGPQLIFSTLPALFDSMGDIGIYVSLVFFTLMSMAALTSTISSTEVPVAYLVEDKKYSRFKSTFIVSLVVLAASMTLVFNFDSLFGAVINWVNSFQLPIMGLFYFIVVGWIYKRGNQLADKALLAQKPWLKLWANYLRFVCPLLLTTVFINVISNM
ncbi:sodium-dependent transporter [Thalassotalea sp. HSM 43]|uniref:sodium-dependent transporter n=1 Tax=Thalassotalea sp. HSM 43 TaxID=2552945 RepID=UPI001080AA9E|nr:sodium-dependent transporter [Thalassotalea sp. HSM 43]QBY03048.1 sodium-dependent transporter [Thalassotalea sp. HSM 43]